MQRQSSRRWPASLGIHVAAACGLHDLPNMTKHLTIEDLACVTGGKDDPKMSPCYSKKYGVGTIQHKSKGLQQFTRCKWHGHKGDWQSIDALPE
jgi:hypothetical protein